MKVIIQKIDTPVIKNGLGEMSPFSWDSLWVYHPCVVPFGNKYYLFYSGRQLGRKIPNQTGLAISNDLKTWKKVKNNPIFPYSKKANEWDSDMTGHACVFRDGNKFSMLYDGSKKGNWLEEIGLADSSDLIHWKRYPKNPIFKVGSNWWEKRHVSRCSVFQENGYYYLFYAGHDGERERIGVARGKSLLSLKRLSKEPILDVGTKNAWDGVTVSDPRVIKWKNKYLLFYSGTNNKGIERTGLTISSDLLHWQKYSKNPILNISKDGWDKKSASKADVKIIDGKLYIFYSCRRNWLYSIGIAELRIEGKI